MSNNRATPQLALRPALNHTRATRTQADSFQLVPDALDQHVRPTRLVEMG